MDINRKIHQVIIDKQYGLVPDHKGEIYRFWDYPIWKSSEWLQFALFEMPVVCVIYFWFSPIFTFTLHSVLKEHTLWPWLWYHGWIHKWIGRNGADQARCRCKCFKVCDWALSLPSLHFISLHLLPPHELFPWLPTPLPSWKSNPSLITAQQIFLSRPGIILTVTKTTQVQSSVTLMSSPCYSYTVVHTDHTDKYGVMKQRYQWAWA